MIQNEKIKVDWIICPGDIADKNDTISARVAWNNLEKLRSRIHARRLFGTVGNHDVDSRREEQEQRPDNSLRSLQPRFPFSEERFFNRFWTQHYVIWKDRKEEATLVVLNSCVLHGVAVPPDADPQHLHGYITDNVLSKLFAELPRKLSKFNILLLHHHLKQHPWLQGEKSHAVNGPKLLGRVDGLRKA